MSTGALFPVNVENKMGYIDAKGRVRIPPQFDLAGAFSEGLAFFGKWDAKRQPDHVSGMKAKYGFIDPAGEVVIPPTFDEALDFNDGLARIRVGLRWGYINAKGEVVVKPQFDQASEFSEGLASARVKKKWRVLDPTGAVVFATDATTVGSCCEGLMFCEKQRKWSYLDRTGNTAFDLPCTAAGDFSDGLAAVLKGRLTGFIDKKGEWVIPPRFAQGTRFREGLARVQFAREGPYDPTVPQDFGFIDKSGDRNPAGSYFFAGDFSEGLAAVCEKYDQGWAYIDARGKTRIPTLACTSAGEFQDGLALIQVTDRTKGETRYGYIDQKGKYVWQPQA
jgi:WG containing repeat